MRVLDCEISIEQNKRLLLDRYKVLLFLLVYTALCDAISTTYFMARIGPAREMNLAVRMLAYSYGIVWGPLFGKVLQIAAVWLITVVTPNLTRFVCATVIFMNSYAVYINMHF